MAGLRSPEAVHKLFAQPISSWNLDRDYCCLPDPQVPGFMSFLGSDRRLSTARDPDGPEPHGMVSTATCGRISVSNTVSWDWSMRGVVALALILDLAAQYGLTIYDPQGDEVTRPHR